MIDQIHITKKDLDELYIKFVYNSIVMNEYTYRKDKVVAFIEPTSVYDYLVKIERCDKAIGWESCEYVTDGPYQVIEAKLEDVLSRLQVVLN